MNLKADFKLLAYIMLFIDAILLIPTGMALYYSETESLYAFILTEVLILIFSLLIILFTRKVKILDISTKDSYIFVTLTWVIATAFGCLPLYFTGTTTSYAESFFEIMSGFTTTGATAIPVVEDHPLSILFWRNLTNWLGGMGIVVLFVAVLPVFGVKGTALVLFWAGLLFFLLIEGLSVSRFWAKGEPGLDYLVVLGAQMRENGPSKALRLRLDTAYDYLLENPDTIVIVSGGRGSNEPVSEAQGMYDYLVGRGIAPERIRMEDRSRNTVENLRFSKAFMEEGASVGIVTNNFHVYRAERLAAGQGYGQVRGIAAPCDIAFQANNMLREFFGIMKDWLSGNMKLW